MKWTPPENHRRRLPLPITLLESAAFEEESAINEEEDSQLEDIKILSTLIQVPDSVTENEHDRPSSLPAIQNWAGNFGFNVTFGPQENVTKNVLWTYSPIKEKLYVGKDVACPINFSTSCVMPEGTYIRAMPLFSAPQHASSLVHRCYNHSNDETNQGLPEAMHLIRCECDLATYIIDSHTERQSVVVPFENPPAGQFYSTYIFKFACFSSCAGGPNRRHLLVVFTLEKGGQVIGRKKVDLKICACPGRDRNNEEKQTPGPLLDQNIPLKRKEPSEFDNLSDQFNFLKSVKVPAVKKTKISPNPDGYYTLTVKTRQEYEFLKHMKAFYNMCKMMKNVTPILQTQLFQLFMKSQENKREESD